MSYEEIARAHLAGQEIEVDRVELREFPGEKWMILHAADRFIVGAQSLAGELEHILSEQAEKSSETWTVLVRLSTEEPTSDRGDMQSKGALFDPAVDKLIQLLEARSRTSMALPSLKYVEPPRARLASVSAARHNLIYGRRGVGKTALLLEAHRTAERQGHITRWFNAHVLRNATPEYSFGSMMSKILEEVGKRRGSSSSPIFDAVDEVRAELLREIEKECCDAESIQNLVPRVNAALADVLRPDVLRLYVYIDDFYLIPIDRQAYILDYLSAALRDCDGWIKVASIERLTRPFEPSSRLGIEVPHDASAIDIDITLENPDDTQEFLEGMLLNYLESVGLNRLSRIANQEALGRLVLASGGVPRDYMNLVAASIGVARNDRDKAAVIGKEDVAKAAGVASRTKKRDLEQDVISSDADRVLAMVAKLSKSVRAEAHTYFLVDSNQKSLREYGLFGQLVDLRFAHLLQSTLSAQHRPGVRYEAYVLDLSEFSDVRLLRGLNILDLVKGGWIWKMSGVKGQSQALRGTQLRDRLRQAPVVDLVELASIDDR